MDDVSTDGATPPRQRAGSRVAAVTRRSADFADYGKQPLPRYVVEDVAWELGVSRATLYRVIELYKTFGTVDVLQPSATGRRSGTWVLPKATEQIIEETIHNVYLKPTRPTLTHLVDCVHARCTEEGVAPPHRRTVRARVKAIDIRVRGQRRGERDIVKATTAVPGEYAVSRPLEVVQIDHTEIDIIVVDTAARPALADPRHRRLLARGDGASCVDECAITRVGRPARNGIRKSSLTLTANLRLGPASVSSQNAQRREKSRSLMPRCQATAEFGTPRHGIAWLLK